MYRCNTGCHRLVILAVMIGLFCTNCGDGEQLETVYLHVLNAYPGSQAASLYGPMGAIETDLPFGERTEEAVAVDRNLGGDLTLILDGAPTVFEGTMDLFALYPQETATLVISQRRGDTANIALFRHPPSMSRTCRVGVLNSMAVSNDAISQYSFLLGWRFANNPEDAGYDRQLEQNEGVLNQDRQDLYNRIDANPYFVPTGSLPSEVDDPQDLAEHMEFAWIGDDEYVDLPIVDVNAGSLVTYPTTAEFIACEQLGAAENCNAPRSYSTTPYSPDAGAVSEIITYHPEAIGNAAGDCSAEWRLFSDFGNIFADLEDPQRVNIEHETDFEAGNHLYMVVYGRPLNPRVTSWTTDEEDDEPGELVDLPDE